jgi:hypothetical protein
MLWPDFYPSRLQRHPEKSMNRNFFVPSVLIAITFSASIAHAGFSKVSEVAVSQQNPHGLAFDGTRWHIAEVISGRFHVMTIRSS